MNNFVDMALKELGLTTLPPVNDPLRTRISRRVFELQKQEAENFRKTRQMFSQQHIEDDVL